MSCNRSSSFHCTGAQWPEYQAEEPLTRVLRPQERSRECLKPRGERGPHDFGTVAAVHVLGQVRRQHTEATALKTVMMSEASRTRHDNILNVGDLFSEQTH